MSDVRDDRQQGGTIDHFVPRDQAHENGYAKALETLGVDWKKTLPIPKTNAEKFPEVAKLVELGLQSKQYSFDLTGASEAGRIYQGMSPSKDGTDLDASEQAPEGAPLDIAPERLEEFAPGLDTDLMELIQKTAEMEMAEIDATFGKMK
jgi:Mn-containing catalase